MKEKSQPYMNITSFNNLITYIKDKCSDIGKVFDIQRCISERKSYEIYIVLLFVIYDTVDFPLYILYLKVYLNPFKINESMKVL